MKTKTTVFYDDADTSSFDSVKNYLFETFGEEEGWVSEDEIPDCVVYHEMEEQQRRDWYEFKGDLEYLLEKDCYLLTGTCGRWNGPAEGGKFIRSIDDLLDCIRHLDFVKFYDENGHFFISGHHHDGSDSYELKRLTKKGYEFADRNYFAHDRELHNTIMNTNFYSALPRVAERLYGVI